MSNDPNTVLIMGNLTRDPELRHVGDAPKCMFRLANNREWGKGDDRKESTTYVDVEAWEGTAEACKRYLAKGSKVFVEGRLELQEWETGGQRRSKLFVNARNVQFLDPRERDDDDPGDRREDRRDRPDGGESYSGGDAYESDLGEIPF